MEMVVIPAGRFVMGSPCDELGRSAWEGPAREVSVPAFAISRCPVTHREYEVYLAENPGACPPERGCASEKLDPDLPVVGVSWHEAASYACWTGGRLPTESEWEYAARAGTRAPYLLGISELDLGRTAWYRENADGRLHPVGEREPNAWGLHDMLGNVWEWVEDDVHSSYDGSPCDGSAWIDTPRSSDRIVRGCAFYDDARRMRAAMRDWRASTSRRDDVGFRIARSEPRG